MISRKRDCLGDHSRCDVVTLGASIALTLAILISEINSALLGHCCMVYEVTNYRMATNRRHLHSIQAFFMCAFD